MRYGQIDRSPLRHSVAGDGRAVAILREQRLHVAHSPDVGVEQLGGKLLDVLKHIPPVNKILIILGRVGDIEIVSAGAVVAGIHPVERKGYLRQHIGADGRLRPCGVYLTGCHIGYVCLEGHGHVGRALIGTSEMHGDAFGNIGQACRHGSSPPFRIGAGHRSGCAPSVISRYG